VPLTPHRQKRITTTIPLPQKEKKNTKKSPILNPKASQKLVENIFKGSITSELATDAHYIRLDT
jgi:hypothetical protein